MKTILLLLFFCITVSATPIYITDANGHVITISPISDYPNDPSPSNGVLFVIAHPGYTNYNVSYSQLIQWMSADTNFLAYLSSNTNFVLHIYTNLVNQGAIGLSGTDGLNGTNGINGTNLVTFSSFPSATNKWTLDNQEQTISLSGNGSVTQVYAPAPFNYSTLWVSNSSASSITFFVKSPVGFPGIWPTNLIVIPPGQMLGISCLCLSGAWTNFAYLPR